jgi:argininosuccinate lyase
MKLWEKGYELDELVESFMTGDDPHLDKVLIVYDCIGSVAHAKMLNKIGILSDEECQHLVQALVQLIDKAEKGNFAIQAEDEDVHTAVEKALIETLGNLGKKLHTARSRNDQVLLDLRLYSKNRILNIVHAVIQVTEVLCDFAQKYHLIPIPGRTHFQRAMPSSLGLWSLAFAESLLDDCLLLQSAFSINDQCPLGSAASYGTTMPIDRQYCADLLGFCTVQNNVLYANNSRGKFEAIIVNALVHVLNDLSKMATDIIIFTAPEFAYLGLPEKFSPGSSLMPQKRNPCALELIRAKSATMQSMLIQILEVTRALPSGYNRDFQETKRPLMQSFDLTLICLQVFATLFSEIQVNKEKCINSFTPEVFATDQVLHKVRTGIPFRDAYKQVALNLELVAMEDPVTHIQSSIHQGSTGNLGLEQLLQKINDIKQWTCHQQENARAHFVAMVNQ